MGFCPLPTTTICCGLPTGLHKLLQIVPCRQRTFFTISSLFSVDRLAAPAVPIPCGGATAAADCRRADECGKSALRIGGYQRCGLSYRSKRGSRNRCRLATTPVSGLSRQSKRGSARGRWATIDGEAGHATQDVVSCCRRAEVVGAERFELPTLCSQNRCATRLRYAPTRPVLRRFGGRVQSDRRVRLSKFPGCANRRLRMARPHRPPPTGGAVRCLRKCQAARQGHR